MSDTTNCIRCGSDSYGEGESRGEGRIYPRNKVFSIGSPRILIVCTNCGEVNSVMLKRPE